MQSLGLTTERMLLGWEGSVEDLGDAWRFACPSNPSWFMGNALVLRAAPVPGSAAGWIARFQEAFAIDARIRHVAIRWVRSELDATAREEFLSAGFQCVSDAVLALRELRAPAHPATGVTVREIVDEGDWRAVFELQLRTAVELFGNNEVVIGFSRDQSARLRRLVEAGHGAWLGAFTADGILAGDLGVFCNGEIARYQSVETAPEHRRRGICATLVHAAARLAQARWRPRSVVIVAASDGIAKPIYESLGFAEVETVSAAFRQPSPP